MKPQLREALAGLRAASLADADKTLRVLEPEIRALQRGLKLVGPARTARCHDDYLTVVKAVEEAEPGEVLVIDTGSSKRAVLGELVATEAARRGLGGIVVDGLVRDREALEQLGLPIYAKGFCPASGSANRLMETQCRVLVAGAMIEPGDILVGDEDGVLAATEAQLHALLQDAEAIESQEAQVRRRLAGGEPLFELLNWREHLAAVERGEASRLRFTVGS